jgi:hypothetical protein
MGSVDAGVGDSLSHTSRSVQAVARPSEVDDRQETMADAEGSTCRSDPIVTRGRHVAIVLNLKAGPPARQPHDGHRGTGLTLHTRPAMVDTWEG